MGARELIHEGDFFLMHVVLRLYVHVFSPTQVSLMLPVPRKMWTAPAPCLIPGLLAVLVHAV